MNKAGYKDILRKLESIEQTVGDPVKIFYRYQLPDGSVIDKRAKEGFPGTGFDDLREWEEETQAKLIDIVISVRE